MMKNIRVLFFSIDRFCGVFLSCDHEDATSANRGVLTTVTPFGFRVYFNDNDGNVDRGFALNYRQELC